MRRLVGCVVLLALLSGCSGVSREPAPAEFARDAPPWEAPRDAISHIRAAGLPELGLGDDTDPWIVELEVVAAGEPVTVPAHIGVDRLRAVQAPVHTHEEGGEVWLEGEGNREATLGQFFTLWGVRFGDDCVGGICGGLSVVADENAVADPSGLVLRGTRRITVTVG